MEKDLETKTPVLNSKIVDLARRYFNVRVQVDQLKKEIKELGAERDQLADALKSQMELEELTKFSLSELGTFFLQSMFFPKVVGDPDKAIEWLDENGAGMIAPRSVDNKRLKEFIEERLANDGALPPAELISSSSIISVKMIKAK